MINNVINKAQQIFQVRRLIAVLTSLAIMTLIHSANVSAQNLPKPQGDVVLTVSGKIDQTSDGDSAFFDIAELENVGTIAFKTCTPWTDGLIEFEGVLLKDLLSNLGAHGDSIRAIAVDNYYAIIPVSDLTRHEVIIATKSKGKYMRMRDRGPLWIIYPHLEETLSMPREIRERSVWQLQSLIIE